MNSLLTSLLSHSKTIALLKAAESLLFWDQDTYMPKEAVEARSEQIQLINSLIHKEETSDSFKDALESLINLKTGEILSEDLTTDEISNLKNWRRDFLISTKIPDSFVKEESELTTKALHAWSDARKKKDFSLFAPYLKKIVALNQKKAELLGYKEHPYDALLDLHEPDMTTKEVDVIFSKLSKKLIPLLKKIQEKQATNNSFMNHEFPIDKQKKSSLAILESLKLDSSFLRLDTSTHPFSISLHPTDCRITTRYDVKDPMSNISSTLHEAGHAMYEHDLDPTTFGSPLSQSASYGIHESQSRFWETCIGKSHAFCEYFTPILKKIFPDELNDLSADSLYDAINTVTPSFIRVEADEVTYCLHIILRFEIEKALIDGSLLVDDLPAVWNAKMQEYLGITPPTDDLGVLQDVHWSMGAIGYFPTYALGNIYAGQLFTRFKKEHPEWENEAKNGNFSTIQNWLKDQIHIHGRRFTPKELIENASKQELSEELYLEYLSEKYLPN